MIKNDNDKNDKKYNSSAVDRNNSIRIFFEI